jgi:transketolase
LSAELLRCWQGDLPQDWEKGLPVFPADSKGMASRVASGQVLNALAEKVPELIGGSADLAPSNKTWLKGLPDFQNLSPQGRNFHFGVRESAMGSALNGMALFGGLLPYGGTFLVFSDYMKPAIRIAALSHIHVIYVFTHDSIGVGEDGPTHQPIEHLAALRATPNVTVIRPGDANETREAWKIAVSYRGGPVALILSRQSMPTLDRTQVGDASLLAKGAYVLADFGDTDPDLILMASGTETNLVYQAAVRLSAEGINVRAVSFPSWELFEKQDKEYRESVFPRKIRARVAVEAGAGQGWERYVGLDGAVLSMQRFGASAPVGVLYDKFGITVDNIIALGKEIL